VGKRSLKGRKVGGGNIQGERHRVGLMDRRKDIGWPHFGQVGCCLGNAGWRMLALVLSRDVVSSGDE